MNALRLFSPFFLSTWISICFNTICWKDYPFPVELCWYHWWISWPYNGWSVSVLCPSIRTLWPSILITAALSWSLVMESSSFAPIFQNYAGCVLGNLHISFRIYHFFIHIRWDFDWDRLFLFYKNMVVVWVMKWEDKTDIRRPEYVGPWHTSEWQAVVASTRMDVVAKKWMHSREI